MARGATGATGSKRCNRLEQEVQQAAHRLEQEVQQAAHRLEQEVQQAALRQSKRCNRQHSGRARVATGSIQAG